MPADDVVLARRVLRGDDAQWLRSHGRWAGGIGVTVGWRSAVTPALLVEQQVSVVDQQRWDAGEDGAAREIGARRGDPFQPTV